MNWKRIRVRWWVAATAASVCFFMMASFGYAADSVTVFAAASTTNAVTEVGELFSHRQFGSYYPSFASSSTLAKQIEKGAPASIFLSANERWMDYLEEKGMVDPATRWNLLGNRLVLVTAVNNPMETVDIAPGFGLKDLLGGGYLAMGDPDHVPAGIYGKQALESLGVWGAVSDRVARQKDVRSALALVEREEAPLGIVYATDAAITGRVKVVGVFPESSHPPIVYPVALVKGEETPEAEKFLDFLKTGDARAVFEKFGFTIP